MSKYRLITDEGTINDLPYKSSIRRSRKVNEDPENCIFIIWLVSSGLEIPGLES